MLDKSHEASGSAVLRPWAIPGSPGPLFRLCSGQEDCTCHQYTHVRRSGKAGGGNDFYNGEDTSGHG